MSVIRILAMLEASTISGSAKAVLEFAREAARGHDGFPNIDLTILKFDRSVVEDRLTRTIREMGTPLDIVFERRRFDTAIISQLHSLASERRPDVIWTNSVKSHFLVQWAGLNRSRKWVAFHHGYTAVDAKMHLYNQLDRWSLRNAHEVFTSSAAFVDELKRSNVRPNRIHVQHMPIRPFESVSEEKKALLRSDLKLDAHSRVLLCVGRLSSEKGHADLMRAMPSFRNVMRDSRVRLVLVGEGPERPRLERLCRELNLTEHVTLAGQQDDVSSYYAIADAFLLPSVSEGCPNVLLEAMSAGVPVVATAVGGIPEVVTDGRDALLVKKRDMHGMVSAAARVLADRSLRDHLVSSGRQIVNRKTPEAYFKSMVSVFSRACANGN